MASSPPEEADHQEPESELEPQQTPLLKPDKKKKSDPTISTVLSEYLEEMSGTNAWSDKTRLESKSVVERLIEIIGDIEMANLSFELARKYKRTLVKLPASIKKDPRYRQKPIAEVIKLKDVKPMSTITANNNISKVVAFVNWSRQNGYVAENFFTGMKLKNKKSAREERKKFSDTDIKKIFNSKIYLPETKLGPARYWIRLLGAFTGARLNEICQLHVNDVIKDDGLWCLDINDNDDNPNHPKKLKNKASRRVIPLHPQLIELGFIKYVDKQRKKKSVRLFPELTLSTDGYIRKVSRWFNEQYLRRRVGISDPDKSFHSFRHTVADCLKQRKIRKSYIS